MTPDERAKLRKLKEAATPGLWTIYRCEFAEEEPEFACGLNGSGFDASHDECNHTLRLSDADYIVAACNAVPALLEDIERLEGERNEFEANYILAKDDRIAANARCERLETALRMQMRWIGPPPTDKHSFDSLREDAWKASVEALAATAKEPEK